MNRIKHWFRMFRWFRWYETLSSKPTHIIDLTDPKQKPPPEAQKRDINDIVPIIKRKS